MSRGQLFVITAPSGAGKSSLIKALLTSEPDLKVSVSYTTRLPRPGEQNGREYFFTDEAGFIAMRDRGEFIECAEVHGHRYGTARRTLEDALAAGSDLILEIDWQGARQVHKLHPQCARIYVLPPSMDELERRLRGRAQDTEEVILRRLENAKEELTHAREFDYAIINDDFNLARRDLQAIVRATRLSLPVQLARHPKLFQE